MIELVKKQQDLYVDVKELVKGDTGPQGPKGDDGYTPVKGVDYFDGADGKDGERGPRGYSGVHIGNEAPTEEDVVVWIKPDGGGEELVAAEGGVF